MTANEITELRMPQRSKPKVGRPTKGVIAQAMVPHHERVRAIDAERQSLATIFGILQARKASTRQEIEEVSGLSRAVVADRLATLLRFGLVDEEALGRPTGGRAPRLVQVKAAAGLVLVAVINESLLGAGVADLSGKLLVEHHEPIASNGGLNGMVSRLETLFDWLLEQQQARRRVWGVGIAVPGPVEIAAGQRFGVAGFHFAPNREDMPLVERLAHRYQAPVAVRNAVQMRTLGELRAGSGVGADNMVFVELGREIVAGLISGGRLHRSVQGTAGMIGHTATGEEGARTCRCGNVGCLEAVAGVEAVVGDATHAAKEGRSRPLAEVLASEGEVTVSDVGVAAQRGDAFSAELLSRCGRHIGTVLAGLVNAFNPSLIVLGGEIAATGDVVLAAIREAVYRRSHPLATRDLSIVRSQMGSSAELVGSAFTVIDDLFAPDFLYGWIAQGSPRKHPEVAELIARAEAMDRHRYSEALQPPAIGGPADESAA
jgi:predicted NBD/HSP70 family sugar kinase